MGGVPEPLGTRGEAGLSCSLATHPHHSPASLRFPFSISTPSDHHQQAQKRRGVSEPLTHRPQSSVHLHKGVEGWAGLCPGSLREEWQWEEETHTNPVFHLLDEQACHCQDGHTGVSAGVGFPPGGKGQAQGPDPKQGALGGQCGSDGQASGSVAQLLPPIPRLLWWEPGWTQCRISGSPRPFPLSGCGWPLRVSSGLGRTWEALPTFPRSSCNIWGPGGQSWKVRGLQSGKTVCGGVHGLGFPSRQRSLSCLVKSGT